MNLCCTAHPRVYAHGWCLIGLLWFGSGQFYACTFGLCLTLVSLRGGVGTEIFRDNQVKFIAADALAP